MRLRTDLQMETNIYNMLYNVSPQQSSKNTNNYRRRYKLVVQLSTPQRNAVEGIFCAQRTADLNIKYSKNNTSF